MEASHVEQDPTTLGAFSLMMMFIGFSNERGSSLHLYFLEAESVVFKGVSYCNDSINLLVVWLLVRGLKFSGEMHPQRYSGRLQWLAKVAISFLSNVYTDQC